MTVVFLNDWHDGYTYTTLAARKLDISSNRGMNRNSSDSRSKAGGHLNEKR